jgi:hypothetical protein
MVVPMVRSGGVCISHLVNFIRKFVYFFFTFNAICEDNTTINCFSVQHKENVHSCQLVGLI